MSAALLPTVPFALRDVEDLADADLEADLADHLEAAGWVVDAQAVAESTGAAALAAHALGARARDLLR
jgi:hypothetical protein